jgi:hypothetical protein
MTEILRRAHDRGWPVYEWCWRETLEPHGWLPQRKSPASARGHRRDVGGRIRPPGTVVRQPRDRHRGRRADVPPRARRVQRHDREAGADRRAVRGARYAHGADWAKKQDYTQVVTLRTDVRPMRLVAWIRQRRMPWPTMVGLLEDRIDEYGGRALHDGTGLGDVIAGYLTRPATAFILVGRDRQDLFSEYVSRSSAASSKRRSSVARGRAQVRDDEGPVRAVGPSAGRVVAGALGYRASRARSGRDREGERRRPRSRAAGRAMPAASDASETEDRLALEALVVKHGPTPSRPSSG